MKAYSKDFRLKVLEHNKTHSITETAEAFNISRNTVFLLRKLVRKTGDVTPLPKNRIYERKISQEGENYLEALILAHPDLTLQELCVKYKEKYQVEVCHQTIKNTLNRLNFTYKKKKYSRKYTETNEK